MITAENIHKSFGTFAVLEGLNLHIKKGSIFGLAGRSGAGKSTFLRCINGLEPIDSGKLTVNGMDVSRMQSKDLRIFRKNIGMIFQGFSLLERLTVFDNVALPLRCWKHKRSHISRKVTDLLEVVGLSDKTRQKPRTLSGGQKQRVAIARALSLEPEILLCDEATSALDPRTAHGIIALLRRINHQLGITVIVVTHQMSVLKAACEEVAIIEKGKVENQGPVNKIFQQQPQSLKNLIGESRSVFPGINTTFTLALTSGEEIVGPMAAELGIEMTIIGGKYSMRNPTPNLLLRFAQSDYPAVESYLNQRQADWQLVDN